MRVIIHGMVTRNGLFAQLKSPLGLPLEAEKQSIRSQALNFLRPKKRNLYNIHYLIHAVNLYIIIFLLLVTSKRGSPEDALVPMMFTASSMMRERRRKRSQLQRRTPTPPPPPPPPPPAFQWEQYVGEGSSCRVTHVNMQASFLPLLLWCRRAVQTYVGGQSEAVWEREAGPRVNILALHFWV